MAQEKYNVLIPYYHNRSNGESDKAELMFKSFINKGFSYDEVSNHPDYLSYASAEMLLDMIPWIIDEMIRRKDTVNYLIHPIIMNMDLQAYENSMAIERVERLISLADRRFAEKACQFLDALEDDPPIEQESFDRVYAFWKKKLEELSG